MTIEAPDSREQIARRAAELIRERLPREWTFAQQSPSSTDAAYRLTSPDGLTVSLLIEAKRVVERRDLASIRGALEKREAATDGGFVGVLAARYLSPPLRAELETRDIAYVDATGNIRIRLDSPGLFLRDRGADRDPWRGAGRPRGTLKGEPAARVVRALIDYSGPWRMTNLVSTSGASVGAAYRVVNYLESEGLLTRDNDAGTIAVPDWQRLLREWSADYNFLNSNRTRQFIEPRGLPALMTRIASGTLSPYAVTGSAAAAEWAPYAPARSAFIYVADIAAAEESWELRPTDSGANVVLIEPKSAGDIVFAATTKRDDGLALAAPAQVAVDLMNGPGRNPSEAEELIQWMSTNESRWRK